MVFYLFHLERNCRVRPDLVKSAADFAFPEVQNRLRCVFEKGGAQACFSSGNRGRKSGTQGEQLCLAPLCFEREGEK